MVPAGALRSGLDLATLLLWGEVMMRFSSMAGEAWRGPGAAWWQGFEAATEPYLQAASPKELLRLGKMLSTQRQQQPVGAAWVAAFLQATRNRCLHPAAGSLGQAGRQADAGRAGAPTPDPAAAAAADAAGTTAACVGAAATGGTAQETRAARPVAQRSQPQRLSARNLANLGKAVVGLGVVPDRRWLQAWELSVELQGCGVSWQVAKSLQQTRAAFEQLASSCAAAEQ